MKMTFALIGALVCGVIAGALLPEIESPLTGSASLYILYALLLFVGADIGAANKGMGIKKLLNLLKHTSVIICGTVFGTLLGGAAACLLTGYALNEGLSVASGFAWYSLSSVLLNKLAGPELGAVAFMSNVFRETFVFLFAPFLCMRGFGRGSVSIAGASSMDVSLSVISKYVDADTAAQSFLHGVMLSVLVPIMVPIAYSL